MTINSSNEWANAIESAEQVMLRWGHGQVRRVPDEQVAVIVAALRAPVSERGTLSFILYENCDQHRGMTWTGVANAVQAPIKKVCPICSRNRLRGTAPDETHSF